jgi:hypothetical protein
MFREFFLEGVSGGHFKESTGAGSGLYASVKIRRRVLLKNTEQC